MLLADRIILLNNGEIVEEIRKEEILDKLDIFQQYDIKVPLVLEIVQKLRQEGIEMNLTNYSIDELVTKLRGIIKS